MAAVLATLTLPLLLEGCVADWDDTSAAVVGVGRVAVWEGGEGGKNKSGEVGTDGSENSGEDGGGVHWMGNNGSWRILSRFAKDWEQSSKRRRDRDGRYLASRLSPFLMNGGSLIVAVRERESEGSEREERSERREVLTEKSDVRERAAIFIFFYTRSCYTWQRIRFFLHCYIFFFFFSKVLLITSDFYKYYIGCLRWKHAN
jgi:hypothetical protein